MSIVDFILPEDVEAYKGIIERAAEAKANAPKVAKVRGPQTDEQKMNALANKLAKLQAKLSAMKAKDDEPVDSGLETEE